MQNVARKVAPLQRETLQDGVYHRLCDLILEGELVPGASVTVASLASAFQVSPMPVRKALTQLAGMGVLQVVSGRTIGVPKLSLERLEDLKNVRSETEALAVRWAVKRADDVLINELETGLERLRKSERKSDTRAFVRANNAFHFAIYRHANSPLLHSTIYSHWLQITPFFHLVRERGQLHLSNDCHEELFEAFKKRDVRRAVSAIRTDIQAAYQVIRGQI